MKISLKPKNIIIMGGEVELDMQPLKSFSMKVRITLY